MVPLIKNINFLHIFNNTDLNLVGCIAISKTDGDFKAIGGTRLAHYNAFEDAVEDSIRLAETMSKKCIIADIPFTGGKAVLLKPKKFNCMEYFREYGKIIEQLNGKFITGCDLGTDNLNMSIVKDVTSHVTGLNDNSGYDYLSYFTAMGVYYSMEICLKQIKNINSLKNVNILIQGVGKVGRALARILSEKKAKVVICDINIDAAKETAEELGCNIIDINNLFDEEYDIFSPCAVGGVINENIINSLKCNIICGAANNQLYNDTLLNLLDKNGIFFMPDWISNVGGAIYAAHSYLGDSVYMTHNKVENVLKRRTMEFIRLKQTTNLYAASTTFVEHLKQRNTT